jgi:AcrR family transcriptional regulator
VSWGQKVIGKKSETKTRLVDSARKLFLERGYEATAVADVLLDAGVNSGSLYYFFRGKEDLLIAVLEQYKTLLWPIVIQPVFDRETDPIKRIFGVLAGYRDMLVSTEFTHGCPIGNLALEMSVKSESVREGICENFEGWKIAVVQCLEDASGRLPEDLDAGKTATFILAVMEGGVMLSRAYKRIEPFDASVDVLRDYVRRLVLPDAHNNEGVSQ